MRCNLCGVQMDGVAWCVARVTVHRTAQILDSCDECLRVNLTPGGYIGLRTIIDHSGFQVEYLPGFSPSDFPPPPRRPAA